MNVGVHVGHDSCAALIINGQIVADVQEERFVRIKHYSELPFKAVEQCLLLGGLTMDDIDAITIASEFSIPDLNFMFEFPEGMEQKKSGKRHLLEFFQGKKAGAIKGLPLYVKRFKVNPRTRII
ncbi:MAG: hypothetical protein LH609_13015, partial [Rudanella sp.]|nr:hypothetical protein [Rudanella sp.]